MTLYDQTISSDIASLLLQNGAVSANVGSYFEFASGLRSPIYVDNRLLISYVEARAKVVQALLERLTKVAPSAEAIVGVATGGVPWAAWVAERLSLPLLYVRPSRKERGLGRRVEGDLKFCSRAVVVEDLVTTGLSSISAVKAIEEESGSHPLGLISVFSYETPVAETSFSEMNLLFSSLTGVSALLVNGDARFSPGDIEDIRRWQREDLQHFVPPA
jgi:orotate phosphoribosyltransferase